MHEYMSEDSSRGKYISSLPSDCREYQGRFNRAIVHDREQYKVIDSAEAGSFSYAIWYNKVSENVVNALEETAKALTWDRCMGVDVDFSIQNVDDEVLKNL
jgi:hypothetical protein